MAATLSGGIENNRFCDHFTDREQVVRQLPQFEICPQLGEQVFGRWNRSSEAGEVY